MTKKGKNKVKLTKEAYERILFYLELARPADSEIFDDENKEINEEIDELEDAIKAILKQ